MKHIIIPIIVFILASCSKEQPAASGMSEIHLQTTIENDKGAPVKAVISGNRFGVGNTLGIFVYHSEKDENDNRRPINNFASYGERYKNVRAVYANMSTGWQYRFEGSGTNFEDVFLIEPPTTSSTTKEITLLSYAPWIEGCTSISSIPFEIGGDSRNVKDMMWAEQNSTTANSIEPDGRDKTVNLRFKHALSLLKIGLKCKHNTSEMALTSITLRKNGSSGTILYNKGSLNAMDGSFNAFSKDDAAQTVTVDYTGEEYKFSQENPTTAPFMIFPVKYLNDGDYILEFKFNGQELAAKYPIKRSDIMVAGDTAAEFRQGYSYTFNFTFNNYLQIDNVTINVSDNWTTQKHELLF